MKALAGVLLAFALAAGVSSEAGAQACSKHSSKHVTKTSVKHENRMVSQTVTQTNNTGCVCRAEKSKLVLTRGLTEANSSPTNCVCHAGTVKTKQVASTGTMKTKHIASTGVMKTNTYGGYKRVNKSLINPNKLGDFDRSKFVPLEGGNLDRGQ